MLKKKIKEKFDATEDKVGFLNDIRRLLHEISDNSNPIDLVLWVPIEKVEANDYNPNSVAHNELKLLFRSIDHDGYTQPIVTIYDEERDKYVIVDGFHRYYVQKTNEKLMKLNKGLLPITIIDKDINDRMASTIRHNRARGEHKIEGMSEIVFRMLDEGWSDARICNELGMEGEELLRLKHITGFSKLFEDVKYRKAWKTRKQLKIKKEYIENQENGDKEGNESA